MGQMLLKVGAVLCRAAIIYFRNQIGLAFEPHLKEGRAAIKAARPCP